MPKGNLIEQYKQWRMGRKLAAQREAEERVKLLPPDLATQILEACGRERQAELARLEVIGQEEARLQEAIAEVRQQLHDAADVIEQPSRRRRRLDGTVVEKPRRGVRVMGQRAIAVRKNLKRLEDHLAALRRERQLIQSKLREINQVEAHAEEGTVSALLHLTNRWRNKIAFGRGMDLPPEARLSRAAIPCDALGNPLPPEALTADGRPAPLPRRPGHEA